MPKFSQRALDKIGGAATFWKKNPSYVIPAPTPDDPGKVITSADFEASVTALDAKDREVTANEQRSREARKERQELFEKAQDHAVRLGKIVVASNPDSADVKELGFVPRSERKRPRPKAKVG